jgi:DNA polymerase III subunit chi
MTRVDFYILPQADDDARWQFTCRLVDKAWRLGNRLLVHTASSAVGQKLDELLWLSRADSFLPHAVLPASQHSPVHIGWNEDSGNHHDLLINLGDSIPGFFSRFERVAEIVCQQPEQLAASRERFRFYRERGYELQIHDMKKQP